MTLTEQQVREIQALAEVPDEDYRTSTGALVTVKRFSAAEVSALCAIALRHFVLVSEVRGTLLGVIAVADRKTTEFDRARALVAKLSTLDAEVGK